VDFSSAIAAATSTGVADFQTNVSSVLPLLLGIGVAGLIIRRVLRFVGR